MTLQISSVCLLKSYRNRLSCMRRPVVPLSSSNSTNPLDYDQMSENPAFTPNQIQPCAGSMQIRAFEKQLAFRVQRIKMWTVTIGISFLLVVLPTMFIAVATITQLTDSSSISEKLITTIIMFTSILCLNSGINAIIYYVMDSELRDAMRSTLSLVLCWRRRRISSISSIQIIENIP